MKSVPFWLAGSFRSCRLPVAQHTTTMTITVSAPPTIVQRGPYSALEVYSLPTFGETMKFDRGRAYAGPDESATTASAAW